MVKRYRKRARKSYRKKRYRKRKMFTTKKYDGGTSIKCHTFADMTYNSLLFAGDLTVNWGSSSAVANTYLRLIQSQEYQDFATLYKEYRLIGVKVRWVPISQVTSALGSYLQEGWYSTSVERMFSNTTPSTAILSSDYYKPFDPSKGFSRYIRCSKYYKSVSEIWKQVGDSYKDACSHFRVFATGYNNGNVLGRVHATYYIKLRSAEV